MNQNYGNAIAEEMKRQGVSQGELSRMTGIPQPTIFRIVSGETENPRASTLHKLASALGMNTLAQSFSALTDETAHLVPVRCVEITAQAGTVGFSISQAIEGEEPPIFYRHEWIKRRGFNAGALLALKVAGSSMEPGIHAGDLVVVNTDDTKPVDGGVFLVNYEGEVIVKRLKRDAGRWWLASDNPDRSRYPDKALDDNAFIIGRVVYKQSEHL